MKESIDSNSSNKKNVLHNIFAQKGKNGMFDGFCANLLALELGGVYDKLCDKLTDLFNDKTNGKKYFDNLVNILEILDYA